MKAESNLQNKWYLGYLLCIAAFGFTIWSFQPGLISADSLGSLLNGREGVFFDINSPIVSYLWGQLDRIVEGPILMFALQNLVFWTACAIFWKTVSRESFGLGLALVLFGLLPHILSQLVVVWKDIAMGVTLFLSVALVYSAKKSGSRIALLISPMPLFFGYAARLNALPAVLPIAIWSGFVFTRLFEIGKLKLAGFVIGSIYFLMLSFAAYFITYQLTEWRTTYPFQQNYLYDLAAISAEKNETFFPEYIKEYEHFSPESIKARYNTVSVSELIFFDLPKLGDAPPLKLTGKPEEVSALKERWLEAVSQNFGIYLLHRLKVFGRLVGLNQSVTMTYMHEGFQSNPPEFRGDEKNLGYKTLMKYFGAFRRPFPQTFFFRAFLWLLFCVYFLYRAIKNKLKDDWELVFVLSISCLFFTFAYFPTTPSTEFRYLFWSAISSAVVMIFGAHLSAQTADNFIGKFWLRLKK
jgi:hypothetical protein